MIITTFTVDWVFINHFYIVLFAALEQNHCAPVTCGSEWVTVVLYYKFLSIHQKCADISEYPPKWCADSAIWLLHGWCHVKLLPSQCKFWVHQVKPCASLEYHFIQRHIQRVHVCFAGTCHLPFWQNDLDLSVLHATVVSWRWNGCWNKSQHRKLTLDICFYPTAGTWTHNFSVMILAP